jgi:hypothetical protein
MYLYYDNNFGSYETSDYGNKALSYYMYSGYTYYIVVDADSSYDANFNIYVSYLNASLASEGSNYTSLSSGQTKYAVFSCQTSGSYTISWSSLSNASYMYYSISDTEGNYVGDGDAYSGKSFNLTSGKQYVITYHYYYSSYSDSSFYLRIDRNY